jgi:Ca-activated chloride channel family protein
VNFAHPHFAEPRWLWLAALAPVCLVLLYRFAAWRRKRQLAAFAGPELLGGMVKSHSPARRAIKHILIVLAVAGIGVALARPQWGETAEVSRLLGEDILFVVDCSKSMLATDVLPSRLGRAKYAILDFVERHGQGRVGLVAFAGEGFLQCPLTFDYDAFRDALMDMDERTIPVPGTDIGLALDEGYRAMEKSQRRKIMVLVTDGEDLEGSGVQTARSLADKGVVIYTIGVGTAAGSPIHIVNSQGMPDVLRDPDGKEVVSHLDDKTLSDIAQATHGFYAPLGALGEGFAAVRRQIENSAQTTEAAEVRKLGVERFYVPVALVIALLVLESLIGTRRNPGKISS